ncbi:SH3 domain-containing YSC84-like protein 1 [Beauveria bassiana]|uniref:SH3 domain-containing YSC84-like protein 1 n=1 Tax=Beauveria bassiana TaxID=176275 RepID=A0A2N6NNY8_BEABA|nr:SH3 domain-containing YSC84-like protein 1 [Beauveria bassiana]
MQKITSHLPSWNTTKSQSKKGFDKAYKVVDKLGAPINRLSNRIGSEAFWPTTLDKESDKAARILKSFCKDGFYTEQDDDAAAAAAVPGNGPKQKQRVLKKIPQSVIANAVGLAIFTTMRTGLWVSGAGGSGVLVARQEHDGAWSPPSGIMLHTAGLGFLVGVDIYDCVLVINTRAALAAFTKIRATIGGEVSAVAGPVGVGGVLENDGRWKQANRPVFTYLKSRGFYAGVQVDGTVVIERSDENARFYNETGIAAADILAGKVRRPPRETRKLMETLKAAEGRVDVDDDIMEQLEHELAPGDVNVASPNATATTFGFPEEDDPDPYGVAALEKEGLGIVEAGSHARVSSDEFAFRPRSGYRSRANTASSTPTHRTSFGAAAKLAQNPRWSRDSVATTASDAATQTEIDQSPEETSPAPPSSHSHSPRVLTRHHHGQADEPPRYEEQGREHIDEKAQSPYSAGADGRLHRVNGHGEEEDGFADAEEAVVKPVVLPKGPPPALPPRQSAETKPVGADFEELDLNDSKH